MSGKAWQVGGKAPKKHRPRYKFDCERCKFHWCCGPLCSCVLHEMKNPPKKRREEVSLLRFKEWPEAGIRDLMGS
jgi:hypothetical protein